VIDAYARDAASVRAPAAASAQLGNELR
jgi:hypothetical protein